LRTVTFRRQVEQVRDGAYRVGFLSHFRCAFHQLPHLLVVVHGSI